MLMTNSNRIPSGTKVALPDGTIAIAYPDTGRSGDRNNPGFCGRYKTYQGGRCDTGWTREQLTVVGYSLRRTTHADGRITWTGVIE